MMNQLYKELKADGSLFDAYIVIKNVFKKNADNTDVFCEYMDLALSLSRLDIEFEERRTFLGEANAALIYYSETVDMTLDSLEMIKEYSEKINQYADFIAESENNYHARMEEEIKKRNSEYFQQLQKVYDDMLEVQDQKEFDALLQKIAEIEKNLDKDTFSDLQEDTYEMLTKSFSTLISKKMEELTRRQLLKRNQEAVKNIKNVFNAFTKNKSKYKDTESNLKALVTSKLFVYDTRDLFNETLVYYNHVYSMIFNEVSDQLKYKLTEWSVQTGKIGK